MYMNWISWLVSLRTLVVIENSTKNEPPNHSNPVVTTSYLQRNPTAAGLGSQELETLLSSFIEKVEGDTVVDQPRTPLPFLP